VACTYFHQSLALAANIRSIPLLLLQLTPIGELLAQAGEPGSAARLWQIVIGHWVGEHAMQKRAQQDLARLAGETAYSAPAEVGEQQAAGYASVNLFVLAAQLQETLASLLAASASVAAQPVAQPPGIPDQGGLIEPLSDRELQILRLLAQGYTNQQIADALTVVVGTVKAHNHHIFGKLGVANRVQALARARELELI
jgi:ATP/maltotriose-dependent transcriptional regulator MalT